MESAPSHSLDADSGAAPASSNGPLPDDDGNWVRPGKDNNFYQTEHDVLFAGIRKGTPVNNGDYMAQSTLVAIMGRMAAYTGKQITWEMALSSKENLSPARYDWGPLSEPSVAIPGVTAFA